MATLDFKGLFGEATSEPTDERTTAARDNIPPAPERAAESPPAAAQLRREAEQQQYELRRAREILKEYQDNTRASGTLKSEILKGTNRGEDIPRLLLQACKLISIMTGDELFYTIIERNVREIYGAGMLEQVPLDIEIKSLERRRDLLAAAYERETETDTREHIKNAYKEVCKRAGELLGARAKLPPYPSDISGKNS